ARSAAQPRKPRGLDADPRGAARPAGPSAGSFHAARAGGTGCVGNGASDGLQRRIGEDPSVARPRGAAETVGGCAMNVKEQMEIDALRLDAVVRARHADALARVSPRLQAQLAQRSNAVLRGATRQPSHGLRNAALAFAALGAL